MKITNVRPWAVEVPTVGVDVEPGGTVEVPQDVAALLLEQPANWAKVSTKSDNTKKKGNG